MPKTRTSGSYGVKTVSPTASAVATGSAKDSVTIIAPASNTADVYVGFDALVDDTNGFPLAAGASINLPMDPDNIFVFVAAATQPVRYIFV